MLTLTFISYIALAYGITESLVFFSGPLHIFTNLRILLARMSNNLAELISCVFCTSTWVGFFLSALNFFALPSVAITPFNILLAGTDVRWLALPLDMFATAGIVWLLYTIEGALEGLGSDNNANNNSDDA